MLRKKLLILLAAAFVLALIPTVAYANFGIHGGYVADTDSCAGCHRAHTATSRITWSPGGGNALLVGPPTDQLYIFCYVCHSGGAPGASTNVEAGIFDASVAGQVTESTTDAALNGGGFSEYNSHSVTSFHAYDGSSWLAWGQGDQVADTQIAMDCGSCHDPHGSSNYRILKDYVNGHDVGGYLGDFAADADPDPVPWVVSNEYGFPKVGDTDPMTGGSNPTYGFRLHRTYPSYQPNYTTARYARGVNPSSGAFEQRLGMSGWCTACHENYMAKVSITPQTSGDGQITTLSTDVDWQANRAMTVVAETSAVVSPTDTTIPVDATFGNTNDFPTTGYIQIESEVIQYSGKTTYTFTGATRGIGNTTATTHAADTLIYVAYDASDGYGYIARHRHPMNVPMSNFTGDRDLTYDPYTFQSSYPTSVAFIDLPLDHDPTVESGAFSLSEQSYDASDWIECLTCHRAHGTDTTMTGYANGGLVSQTFPGGWGSWLVPDPNSTSGVPPAEDSALLRAPNRGVCERCHNK